MSRPKRKQRYFMCDFETTVYEGQSSTEVWAAACVEFNTENVNIMHSIEEQYLFFLALDCDIVAYYHNLKFDGAFWLDYLLRVREMKQAYDKLSDKEYDIEWTETKYMENNTFKYSISDQGQWYTITIKVGNRLIQIRDSLKLLPFSVKSIGKSFKTKHQKLDMEYTGYRYAGCNITDEEKEYIKNDVLVVKEALEMMFAQGHKKLTIGSCCLAEFKRICDSSTKNQLSYDEMFPDLTQIPTPDETYGCPTADAYIRRSYRGGWCYLAKGKENKVYTKGITADVNSLYPSVMHSESGNFYPVGVPQFWAGNYIPDEALGGDKYFFVRVKTRFYLKDGMLPFIQIKTNPIYTPTECLETSDIYDYTDGKYYSHYLHPKTGEYNDTRQEMTLTMTDYYRMIDHYELVDFEILDGCYFYSMTGIFDEYIEKYKKIKMTSTGAMRQLAKLFLNNLYGKLASNFDSSFKFAYIKETGATGFVSVHEENKKAGYIACGSAITSYARDFTIRHAQKNYHGKNKRGFIYADTDSIHCDLNASELVGIKVDDNDFNCWKLESTWDEAIFARQKTYIEHITQENLDDCKPYYSIKCAGMPDTCKRLFELSMSGEQTKDGYTSENTGAHKDWTQDELDFLFDGDTPKVRTLEDFKVGLVIPGKLTPKRIKGGVVLQPTPYEMRQKLRYI